MTMIAKIRKADRLGNDRPSYEPAWVWVVEALGVCGKGFGKRLGEPPAGLVS